MKSSEYPRIVYGEPFDERAQFEAKARGYLSNVKVQMADGSVFSVVFYDCVRLGQDMEYEVTSGRMCVADPGMIVLADVTAENIGKAVKKLTDEGFFAHLKPL